MQGCGVHGNDAHPDVTDVIEWRSSGLAITTSRSACPAGGWGHEHEGQRDGIALPVRGAFRRRVDGREHFVAPATGFFRRVGEISAVAHFDAELHSGTIVDLDRELTTSVVTDVAQATGPFVVTPQIDAEHRRLAASMRSPAADDLEIEERTFALLGAVVSQRVADFTRRDRRATSVARRRVAHDVCEHLHRSPSRSLAELAGAVHYSPFHLSRMFREEIGTTISAYRRNLRIHEVLLRLDAGERDLHRLAADIGFVDHSHMTRTIVARVGRTPSALRAELAALSASA